MRKKLYLSLLDPFRSFYGIKDRSFNLTVREINHIISHEGVSGNVSGSWTLQRTWTGPAGPAGDTALDQHLAGELGKNRTTFHQSTIGTVTYP